LARLTAWRHAEVAVHAEGVLNAMPFEFDAERYSFGVLAEPFG
jgi:hypothetical protein